jgi:hypothetical protein
MSDVLFNRSTKSTDSRATHPQRWVVATDDRILGYIEWHGDAWEAVGERGDKIGTFATEAEAENRIFLAAINSDLHRALSEARQAYAYAPNSYTNSAYQALLAAGRLLEPSKEDHQ